MKLKLGLPFSAISVLFGVTQLTVSRRFYKTQKYFESVCKNPITWPSNEHVDVNYTRIYQKLIQ